MPLGTEVGLGPGDIVIDGTQLAPQRGTAPQCVLVPKGCTRMHEDITWYRVSLSLGDIVLDGDPAPPSLKGHTVTQFSAHVYCGQTARCMKTPLGKEVDLGPGHVVLDGDPAPPRKWHSSPPPCRPMSIVATVAHLSYY